MAGADKERTQRRVYVLPTDLVERITAFQLRMGLPSEVEAARRLLDEALKHRDDAEAIIVRFCSHMKETKVLSDIVKEVLVGHPLVAQIQFEGSSVRATMVGGQEIFFNSNGGGYLKADQYSEEQKFDALGEMEIPF